MIIKNKQQRVAWNLVAFPSGSFVYFKNIQNLPVSRRAKRRSMKPVKMGKRCSLNLDKPKVSFIIQLAHAFLTCCSQFRAQFCYTKKCRIHITRETLQLIHVRMTVRSQDSNTEAETIPIYETHKINLYKICCLSTFVIEGGVKLENQIFNTWEQKKVLKSTWSFSESINKV